MCSIIGALLRNINTSELLDSTQKRLFEMWESSHQRGRDGRGYDLIAFHAMGRTTEMTFASDRSVQRVDFGKEAIDVYPVLDWEPPFTSYNIIGNLRAEPTTEYVARKQEKDQQPYSFGRWSIVHNGTISNDVEIRDYSHEVTSTTIDSAAILELLTRRETSATIESFGYAIRELKGSFAILATNMREPRKIFFACNYRPIWFAQTEEGFYITSSRSSIPEDCVPQMVNPYSIGYFSIDKIVHMHSEPLNSSLLQSHKGKALVVCSGGLDSVVSAALMQARGYEIHLIHFQYGSRAEGPEVKAVQDVAKALGAPLTLFPLPVYDKGDSPLLDPDSAIAGGEAGAEFAHEWVPARNLLLLSVATAFAEAKGFETLVLGNNLEEAGAYPDNEPEFIDRFNDLLPFAIGDGKKLRVEMPVGNMMKHEIVALGDEVGAPMNLTWSCYRAGKLHCGKCGPCFTRRTAFEINNIPEVVEYKE